MGKGHILSSLLTLSGAMLSCVDHESFPSKFFFVVFNALVYLFVLHWDFLPLYVTYGPTGVHFSARFFLATGYCGNFFFFFIRLV